MGIAEDLKRLIDKADRDLAEAEKGVIVLERAGEDVEARKAEVNALKTRIDGFKAGLKEIS